MSDGKSFLERREQAEIATAQIREIAPDAKSVSFIERQEIHHHHHHGAPRGQALEDIARDIARGLEETFTPR